MQSIPPPGDPHSPRLRCAHCGLTAVAGDAAWAQFTATSHAGSSESAERAGHLVGMEVCRHCLRDSLRSALGMVPPPAPGRAPRPAPPMPEHDSPGQRVGRAMRSMERTNAFIRASERRLARWQEADRVADRLAARADNPEDDSAGQNGGSSALSSAGAAASLGATRGAPDASASSGQATPSVGSSQRSERSQSRA